MFDLSILPVSDPFAILFCALVFGVAAVMSGLSGFGFSAIGSLSLLVLPNVLAISLLMALSIITQANSFGALWKEMRANGGSFKTGFSPYVIGGLLGLPIGIYILLSLSPDFLMISFGSLLIVYSIYSLSRKVAPIASHSEVVSNPKSSLLVGFAGGVVGGFSAFPGSALVIWTGFKGFTKEKSRSLIQSFVFLMQIVGLIMISTSKPENFGGAFMLMFILMLPTTIIGSFIGIFIQCRSGFARM